MKTIISILIIFHCCNLAYGQTTLTTGSATLFSNCKSKLSNDEKNSIYKLLGFVLSADKDQPFASDKDSKDYPFAVIVMPTDMNKDGKEEIFISFGNSYTSGNTGSSISLFIKDAKGVYADNLGFPGIAPDVLATVSQGYPDLLIGGPGFEYPVWRWNGKVYVFSRNVKDADYAKLKKQNIEEVSKVYQLTIK
jgi:hypothetical protein